MITFNSISQLPDRRWVFNWSQLAVDFYRVILNGRMIASVPNPESGEAQYIFGDPGPYSTKPPPLEVVGPTELADSEVDTPFLRLQWYNDTDCDRYEVQEFVSGQWVRRSTIATTDAAIHTVTTVVLADESTYQFRVIGYNETGEATLPLDFVTETASPPLFDDTTIAVHYDEDTNDIIIQFTI